jgi:hypothetical protein
MHVPMSGSSIQIIAGKPSFFYLVARKNASPTQLFVTANSSWISFALVSSRAHPQVYCQHRCVFPEIPTRLAIRSRDCAGADSEGHRQSADFT